MPMPITDPKPARYYTRQQFASYQQTLLQHAELRPVGGTDRLRRFIRPGRVAHGTLAAV